MSGWASRRPDLVDRERSSHFTRGATDHNLTRTPNSPGIPFIPFRDIRQPSNRPSTTSQSSSVVALVSVLTPPPRDFGVLLARFRKREHPKTSGRKQEQVSRAGGYLGGV